MFLLKSRFYLLNLLNNVLHLCTSNLFKKKKECSLGLVTPVLSLGSLDGTRRRPLWVRWSWCPLPLTFTSPVSSSVPSSWSPNEPDRDRRESAMTPYGKCNRNSQQVDLITSGSVHLQWHFTKKNPTGLMSKFSYYFCVKFKIFTEISKLSLPFLDKCAHSKMHQAYICMVHLQRKTHKVRLG